MDLKTCRKLLTKQKYKRYCDFFGDIQLIWHNCKIYNVETSDIYKLAEQMERFSRRAINLCKEEFGMPYGTSERKHKRNDSEESGSENAGSEPGEEEDFILFDQKVAFVNKVKDLSNEGLTKLVRKVKYLCPAAIDDIDDEKLHIRVDKLDRKSFEAAEVLVEEELARKGGEKSNPEEPTKKRQRLE